MAFIKHSTRNFIGYAHPELPWKDKFLEKIWSAEIFVLAPQAKASSAGNKHLGQENGNFDKLGWSKYAHAENDFVLRYSQIVREKKQTLTLPESDLRDLRNFASCISSILEIKGKATATAEDFLMPQEAYQTIAGFLSKYDINALSYSSGACPFGYVVLAGIPFIIDVIVADEFESNLDMGIVLIPLEDVMAEYKLRRNHISIETVTGVNCPDKIIAVYCYHSGGDEIYDKDGNFLSADMTGKTAKINGYTAESEEARSRGSKAIIAVIRTLGEVDPLYRSLSESLETAEISLCDTSEISELIDEISADSFLNDFVDNTVQCAIDAAA